MKKLLSIFLLLIITTSLFAQGRGTIKGKVIDPDNYSLYGANVYIKALGKGSATDQSGEFIMVNVEEGTQDLTISYLGYQTKTISVEVKNGNTTLINVNLNPGSVDSDEIIVLGDRLKGQSRALSQQRSNENITNVIASEQIGRFPDANIGDALKRIPAINVYYDQGEARFANVRGTEPKLNSVMINGERMPSAEGETRAVQLDLVPAEMIQTIEVNKAVLPVMDADAIGGAINLVTRSAPNGLRLSGTLGSGYNFLSKKPQYLGSFVFGQRYFDDKLGLVISGSYHDHNLGSDNAEGVWLRMIMVTFTRSTGKFVSIK